MNRSLTDARRARPVLRALRRCGRCESGQDVAEAAIVLPFLLIIALGIFEFGSAIGTKHTLTSLGREGASIAARGEDLDTVNDLMMEGGGQLEMKKAGGSITSRIFIDEDGRAVITEQVASPRYNNRSRLGRKNKFAAGLSKLAGAEGETFHVVELFYTDQEHTPLAALSGAGAPDTLYSRALF